MAFITYKRVKYRPGFRRLTQNALRLKDADNYQELKLAVSGSDPDTDEIVFVDECVFSAKTFKPMAWSHTRTNITQ